MTVRLASDGPRVLHADTLGGAWLAVAGRILAEGVASRYDGLAVWHSCRYGRAPGGERGRQEAPPVPPRCGRKAAAGHAPDLRR